MAQEAVTPAATTDADAAAAAAATDTPKGDAPAGGDLTVALRESREQFAALKAERDTLAAQVQEAELAKLSAKERAEAERDNYKTKYEELTASTARVSREAKARVALAGAVHDVDMVIGLVDLDKVADDTDAIETAYADFLRAHPFLLKQAEAAAEEKPVRVGAGPEARTVDADPEARGKAAWRASASAYLRSRGI